MSSRLEGDNATARGFGPVAKVRRRLCAPGMGLLAALVLTSALAAPSPAQEIELGEKGEKLVQLDFNDVELAVVLETIARLTGKNFIYDDRVRGRVTIVSPTPVTLEQAYAVFESVLQVKGFTTLEGPGGVIKIIPVRAAKESSIETVRSGRSPNRDHYVTRLIPLRFIDAQEISTTLKPLIAKDAAIVTYRPTNTLILTDTSSNIRRIMSIIDAIDVESYREELAVIKIRYADAATLGEQISQIFGADVSSTAARRPAPRRSAARAAAEAASAAAGSKIRIITDSRTNSLLVLAPSQQIDDVRGLVRKLDVPVTGSGRIHVYYLRHADSEELAQTLQALLGGGTGRGGAGGAQPQALRSAVTELADGISVTADPATNSLVIQASKEGYETLVSVIEQLDIQRPQVLVEALIMEVLVSDDMAIGINWAVQLMGDWDITIEQAASAAAAGFGGGVPAIPALGGGLPLTASSAGTSGDTLISAILRASATDGRTNVLSAPHILTSDNEEAEIKIGNNIPIVTSRVESAAGQTVGLASSVNVDRQDIGVTLRVTPQISEGDTLRLQIYQEITAVNATLQGDVGNAEDVGPALTSRKIENTLVVSDGETVVIGGLISEQIEEIVNKVPWLGDIPFLGWFFKVRTEEVQKINLLVFLTPHIIRSAEDLELATMRKRAEFRAKAGDTMALSASEEEEALELGLDLDAFQGGNPVRGAILDHAERYPLRRMREIEERRALQAAARVEMNRLEPTVYSVRAAMFRDEGSATRALTELVDAGYDGTLVSGEYEGVLLYEILVGPYEGLREAQTASAMLRGAFDYDPTVTVISQEGP